MSSKVLIVVDMQNDFIDGSLGTPEAVAIVPKVKERIEKALESGERVLFTMDTHGEDYMSTQEGRKLPVRHCIKGSWGHELSDSIKPFAKDKDDILEKHTFGSSALPLAVQRCDGMTLIGLCTDICVITNALLLKTYFPEKEIIVDASLCAGVTPASHRNALEAMKMCQIDVINE